MSSQDAEARFERQCTAQQPNPVAEDRIVAVLTTMAVRQARRQQEAQDDKERTDG